MSSEMGRGPNIKLWILSTSRNKQKGNLKRRGRRKTKSVLAQKPQKRKQFKGKNGQQ